MLNLKPGQKVLDIGCGIGGGDFYMAKVRAEASGSGSYYKDRRGSERGTKTKLCHLIIMNNDVTFQTFGVEVLGLDLSDNMVNIAMERAVSEKLPAVRLDITSPN